MTSGYINKLHTHDDGNGLRLYATGNFASAANVPGTSLLARWSGSAWESVGGGLIDQFSNTLETYNGALIVGGYFNSAAGTPGTAKLARYSGGAWASMGAQLDQFDDAVWALKSFDDGSGEALYIGGNYLGIAGTTIDHLARFDGTTYTSVGGGTIGGAGIPLIVMSMQVWNDGNGPALYIGGRFLNVAGVPASRIAKWNGTTWSDVGGGVTGTSVGTAVYAMQPWDDGSGPSLFVAGQAFTAAGGVPVSRIARWDGAQWHDVGGGANNTIWDLKVFNDGSGEALYAVGVFTSIGGVAANRIAKWNGASWSAVPGTGPGTGADTTVFTALTFDDGSGPALWIGGSFTSVESMVANRIARYDGCDVPQCVPADIDCNGAVNVQDLLTVINSWGACASPPQPCPADIAPAPDGDSTINVLDLLMVINNWGS